MISSLRIASLGASLLLALAACVLGQRQAVAPRAGNRQLGTGGR